MQRVTDTHVQLMNSSLSSDVDALVMQTSHSVCPKQWQQLSCNDKCCKSNSWHIISYSVSWEHRVFLHMYLCPVLAPISTNYLSAYAFQKQLHFILQWSSQDFRDIHKGRCAAPQLSLSSARVGSRKEKRERERVQSRTLSDLWTATL